MTDAPQDGATNPVVPPHRARPSVSNPLTDRYKAITDIEDLGVTDHQADEIGGDVE